MGALATALATDSDPHILVVGEKTYRLNHIDQRMKVALEKHLFQKAFQAEELMKSARTEEEYAAKLDKLKDDYEKGVFAFESQKSMDFLKSPAGIMKLASLIVGVDEMELLKIFAEKQAELITMIKVILKESLG